MEEKTKRYYAAYGSNLNVRQMLYRCPDALIIGTAYIPNHQLMFKGSKTGAYLTIEQKEGSRVPVGIWTVSETDEKNLDRYEGFPAFYYKREMILPVKGIRTGKVRERKIFVYVMHEERTYGIPTDRYFETCVEGYEDFGFDYGYLIDADDLSMKGVMENESRK